LTNGSSTRLEEDPVNSEHHTFSLSELTWFPAAALRHPIFRSATDSRSATATISVGEITFEAVVCSALDGRIITMTDSRENDAVVNHVHRLRRIR